MPLNLLIDEIDSQLQILIEMFYSYAGLKCREIGNLLNLNDNMVILEEKD
jgi:hypothetical protein